MLRLLNIFLVVAAGTLVSGCRPDHSRLYGGIDNEGGLDAGPPDFSRVRAKIFSPYCTTCHSAFSIYSVVISELAPIEDKVMTDHMPLIIVTVPDREKALLQEWIISGAPEILPKNTSSAPQIY